MRFTIAQPVLKTMVSVLSSIVEEAKIVHTEKGLEVACVDTAHVAMAGFTIPESDLEGFEAEDTEEFGLDLKKMQSILKLTSSDDKIQVIIGDKMTFKFGNITRTTALLDASTLGAPRIPPIDAPVTIKMGVDVLQTALKGVQDIGEAIQFKVADKTFSMIAEDDTNSSEFTAKDGDGASISEGNADSTFPPDYVANAIKSLPSTYVADILLGEDYPIRIDFTDGKVEGFYLIAPRIDSE